jgi:glucosamine--fructose-6-phosphate aminotransferase (isomerizing)
MCGIIAVLRRRSRRAVPERPDVEAPLAAALALDLSLGATRLAPALDEAAARLEQVDALLRGTAGIRCLLADPDLADRLHRELRGLDARVDDLENELDRRAQSWSAAAVEAVNAALVRLRDASWAVHRDRLRTARAVADLAGERRDPATIDAYSAVQTALSALDRLEVRGRDSAGLHVLVEGHALDTADAGVAEALHRRCGDPLFRSGSVRVLDGGRRLGFVYKQAAEIGELGDNVRALRDAIRDDDLLRRAVAGPDALVTVLGHTRWASVGIISEPNAHPLEARETDGGIEPYVVAALNGDVDNHLALVGEHELRIAPEITTDAKVIPTLIARRLGERLTRAEAFRATVASFEGSTAIAASTAEAPGELLLALRGSGQALYVGLGEDGYVVASEPYGVIEDCARYLRMDGETPGNPNNPTASRGQIVRLARADAGSVHGIERIAFDGTPLPVAADQLTRSSITTRDVDRGDFPHFLLKEISESPRSFRKTLRGRITEADGRLRVQLGTASIPTAIRQRLRDGSIRRVLTIGQGTAAVAGQGVAAALEMALRGARVAVASMPATELSGFRLEPDMSDTLIVAISQSGTTTDTNRTVDLLRARGAAVVAIVNRRGSDLTDKADGVIYTSDGRDVEMSVASTKAFYAQIAAGFLLAFAVAQELGCCDDRLQHEVLAALRSLPDAMGATLGQREQIARAARDTTRRRYWALCGNGGNLIAAREIRIKLSELCYKSIACDATEDKKHIDLSSEPMILCCAAGLSGSTADDVAKEVAIYRAHKALPIVIADEGEERFQAACHVIRVPRVHPALGFVLSTVAGHLFGYECALAIDALARPLREARAAIERNARSTQDGEALLDALAPDLVLAAKSFVEMLRDRRLDGSLEAATATRLASLLRYATGVASLDGYQLEFGEIGTPALVVDELTDALTKAIEELTRPVDAIKHQAKTVTVGISRSDESLTTDGLVREVLATGLPRDAILWSELRTLAALSPAVEAVLGYSRYALEGEEREPRIRQIDAGGIARGLRSRTQADPRLRGTKHQVARERRVLVARGASDDRTVVLVPEVRDGRAVGLTLLHVVIRDRLGAADARSLLTAYRNRYSQLCDAVTETEPSFRDELLAERPVLELLTESIEDLARAWRSAPARTGERA